VQRQELFNVRSILEARSNIMELPYKEIQQHQPERRNSVIALVTNPLGFFTLVVLIVEAVIGGLAASSAQEARPEILWAMCGILVFLVVIVALLAYLKPGVLYGRSNAIYSVVISPPKDMPGLEMSQLSWPDGKCFLTFREKKTYITPVIGDVGPSFEVRIPPEILFELTAFDTVRLELTDDRGLRWDAGPFYVHQKTVKLIRKSSRADILAAYGDEQ
jgi:hypothetical protein